MVRTTRWTSSTASSTADVAVNISWHEDVKDVMAHDIRGCAPGGNRTSSSGLEEYVMPETMTATWDFGVTAPPGVVLNYTHDQRRKDHNQ